MPPLISLENPLHLRMKESESPIAMTGSDSPMYGKISITRMRRTAGLGEVLVPIDIYIFEDFHEMWAFSKSSLP